MNFLLMASRNDDTGVACQSPLSRSNRSTGSAGTQSGATQPEISPGSSATVQSMPPRRGGVAESVSDQAIQLSGLGKTWDCTLHLIGKSHHLPYSTKSLSYFTWAVIPTMEIIFQLAGTLTSNINLKKHSWRTNG